MATRRGPVTQEELAKLKEMVLQGFTDKEISDALGRSEITIRKRRTEMDLKKGPGGKEGNFKIDRSEEIDFKQRIEYWIKELRKTKRYSNLTESLTADDLKYFCEQWAIYHMQMEDMQASEEDTLELLIVYQIRINENKKSFKDCKEFEKELEKKIKQDGQMKELDLENEDERVWYEFNESNKARMTELNKDLKDLADRHDKLLESLNVTRRQREENQKIGGDTFLSLIKTMNDNQKRKQIGDYNERMRLSTQIQIRKLKQPHLYADGDMEPVILDGEDFKE